MLRFAEEIILLTLDEKSGQIASGMSPSQFSVVLAGAVLMDLALENRIDTDLDSLVLVDSTPTGDALLDPTLAKVAASAAHRNAAYWIGETTKASEEIRETALARLKSRGILDPDSFSEGVFVLSNRVARSRRYPTVEGEVIEEVWLRVMRILFADDIPSPRDVALICLADACNVFSGVFMKSELDEVRRRINLIKKMDLLGRTVISAVQAFEVESPPPPRVRPWTDLPCPRQLPIIGNFVDMARDMRGFFTTQYRTFGPVFRIRVLGTDLIIMAGPEANRFVAKGNNYFGNDRMWNSFNSYLGVNKSLIGVDGPEHLQMRRDHAGFYSHKLIGARIADAVEIVKRAIADWPLGASVTGFRACQKIIAEQLGFLATGMSPREYIDDIIRFSNTMLGVHVSRHVPKWSLRLPRFRRSHKRVEKFIRNVLDAHSAGRREDESSDLIDTLLEINAKQPHYIPQADMKIFALGPFLAGLDTAAATCAFMLYEALKNPQLLKRITEEADLLFRDGTPALSDVRSLDVIQLTMRETLRMYPLTVTVMRRVANRFEFQGYSIPAGADVLIPFSLPHFMEEYWSNPSEFDVERFGQERAEHTKERGIYEPFGVGAHACLGVSLAEALISINIATILHHLELDLDPPGYRIKVRQLPGLHPHSSLKFRVKKKRTW